MSFAFVILLHINNFKIRFDVASILSKTQSKSTSFSAIKKDDFITNFIASLEFSF